MPSTSAPKSPTAPASDWAVVTGASDGIGAAFAEALAARGHPLVLVARGGERLHRRAEALQAAHGIATRVWPADLSVAGSVAMLADATRDLDVGVLVAAAGYGSSGALLDADLGPELAMIDLNCRAVLELCWRFGRRFRERGAGDIVLMSSLLAFQGVPRAANYAATKAYVQSLAEGLRLELAPHGVQVIASAPGPIASGFGQRARLHMPLTMPPAVVARQTLDQLGRRGTVRPGWLSKGLGWSLATLPRWGQVRVMGQVMKGMTAHQSAQNGPTGRP